MKKNYKTFKFLVMQMTKKIFFIMLILIFAGSVSIVHASNRVALVIGNGAYKISPLKNPANDAREIARALKKFNFEVILKINASKREIKTSVRNFGNFLRKGGVGLFFYAGHGIQLNGRNYLIPINADITTESEVEYEAFDAGRILGQMKDVTPFRNAFQFVV